VGNKFSEVNFEEFIPRKRRLKILFVKGWKNESSSIRYIIY
jgi:hypothetical protein